MSDIALPITDANKAWVAFGLTLVGSAVSTTLAILAVTQPGSTLFLVLSVIAAVLTVAGVPFGVHQATNNVIGTQLTEASQLAVVPTAPKVIEAPATPVVEAPTVDPTATFAPVAAPSADV